MPSFPLTVTIPGNPSPAHPNSQESRRWPTGTTHATISKWVRCPTTTCTALPRKGSCGPAIWSGATAWPNGCRPNPRASWEAGLRGAAAGAAEDDFDRPRRPRDDRDDDYRPRRRTAKKKGPSTGLIVGLSVGGVVLLIGIIVGVVLLVNSGGGGSRGGNVGPGTYHGVLGVGDPRDTQLRRSPCHIYNVQMNAGRTYIIDHMSDRFDCFLRLEDAAGRQLMVDDDGGVGLNSKIIFRPPANGQYRVIATSLSGRGGPYTLTIVEN